MSIIWRLICGGKNAEMSMSGHEQIYPRHNGYLFHHDLAPLKLLGSTTAKPLTGHGNVGHGRDGWHGWHYSNLLFSMTFLRGDGSKPIPPWWTSGHSWWIDDVHPQGMVSTRSTGICSFPYHPEKPRRSLDEGKRDSRTCHLKVGTDWSWANRSVPSGFVWK